MKLNCGKTPDQRWEDKERIKRLKRLELSNWHSFFCFWPRRITNGTQFNEPIQTNDCRWLETVERRGSWVDGYYHGGYWNWEFRPVSKN